MTFADFKRLQEEKNKKNNWIKDKNKV
jgi:hypothetical protein